jgi:hypothetical protein
VAGTSLDILIQAQDNASKVLESIQTRVNALGNDGPGAFTKIDAAAASAHTRVAGLYTAAVALVGAFAGSKLVTVPAQFESLSKQLETVTKSSAAAEAGMAWVTDFATKTPYELGKVAEAFAKLTSYGFDPKEILTPIGNAASGMQKDLDQAVEAFADATRGEFERLKEFGINAEVSGNQVTLSYMQNGTMMEKSVTKNAEAIGKALSGIWTDMYAGGMDAQMTTFSGVVSNMLDAVTRKVLQFSGSGLFESVKDKIKEITAVVEGLGRDGKLEEWGRTAKQALEYVWESGKRALTVAGDFTDRWGSLLATVGTVAALALAAEKIGALTKALTSSKLGVLGLALAIPDAIDGYVNLARAANEYFNPQSTRNKALKQAADLQNIATENNKKAVAALNQYAQTQGQSVDSLKDWNKKVADGSIKLKDHAGNVALTATEYKALQTEVKKAGEAGNTYLSQVADRYDQQAKEAKALSTTEGAAAAAGLAAQRDKYKAVLTVAQSTAAAQIRLINEAAGTEQQKAQLREQVEKDLQKAKVAALKSWVDDLKSGLDDALAQEKRYAQEAENAHKTTEDKVRELRRGTMSEYRAYYDQIAEAREKLSKAETAAASGTAEGYDKAIQYAKEAQTLFAASVSSGKDVVGNAQAVQTAINGVAGAGEVWEKAAQAGKEAWKDTAQSLMSQIQEAKSALNDIQKTPLSMSVNVDTSEVDKALDALNGKKTESAHSVTDNSASVLSELDKLQGHDTSSTHTVYEKKVEAYAAGGTTSRNVPAMVMPGEVVIEPERAGALGPLLHAINSMRVAREAVQHFDGGGGVFRPFRSGLVPGVGDEDSEPVLLPEGAFVVKKAAVQRYGAQFLQSLGKGSAPQVFANGGFALPAGIQALASGGFALPDWLRRLQEQSAAAMTVQPAGPGALPGIAAAQATTSAPASLTTSLAAPKGASARGVAAVSRLDGLRQSAAITFSSGGSLDETLADIALERKRTKEDYDIAVADAQESHDDDLAELLKQEQSDLDEIAATLAETLADLQKSWVEAQKTYAEAVQSAKSEYAEKKASLQQAVVEAAQAYAKEANKDKTQYGYTKTQLGNTGLIPGNKGKVTTTYWVSDKKALAEHNSQLATLRQAVTTAKQALAGLGQFSIPSDVTETWQTAQSDYSSGVDAANTTAATDTESTKSQADADKADLEKTLADTLADLKLDYDRAMEDLDIEEARARADADDEKGYSISGFSQWLRDGGPVKALERLRKFAKGGPVTPAGVLGRILGFADGGTVPMLPGAIAGQDSVPAVLTPGEGVVRAEAMAKVLSERALDALNNLDLDGFFSALPRFNTGGLVPGGDVAAVAALPTRSGASSGESYTATLNLAVGGRQFETRTTAATAAGLVRELRKVGVNVK